MKNSIFILIVAILLLSCKDQSKKEKDILTTETISKTENVSNNLDLEGINELFQKSSPYTRDSGDFFGVEALVFDGNTVRFSVASLYVMGEIIDREDITGTYKVSSNGNTLTVQFDFNTNFVFVDYLIDGSKKNGKSIKEVSVPYILKGTKTKDDFIILKDWENKIEKEERIKQEEIENNKEEVIEDYGIDENTILGRYKSSDEEKDVSVSITSIDEKELSKFGKKGVVSGVLMVKDVEKEFTSAYETGYDGNRYTFSIDYKKDRGRTYGVLFVFENGLEANFFSDSGASKRFELEKIDVTEEVEEENSIVTTTKYFKINDPDGYSNLRDKPKGEVIRKVLKNEKFEVLSSDGEYKKVKLSDGTIGYIHSSRVVKL
ncbi:SH3 domain-containing protein [Marinirhabdus gelatinilytica]|uniref:SH3 domain-containing protein n=1 Tax=Marinirhabdus gelatinilytica TaxID=1703343 RepID=A0A370QF28_9FLAO|nr:SH3 domain-containing protein [Marinirhabdus gelatinilytica]RDK86974.1 SH3 domain-containing protein [Marinirhabdus gelatinilytica]